MHILKEGATMKAFLIDSKTDEFKAVDIEPTLKEYYRMLGCDCIDITVRRIGGVPYNIIVDDEGLLKPNRVSACCVSPKKANGTFEVLAGNLLIFGIDPDNYEHGNKSLDADDVENIKMSIGRFVFEDGSVHPVLAYSL